MSVREEEQRKSNPSRGLGLAAAAIGVGVGAALYYLFSKRTENPDSEGSTSQNWTCEPHNLSPIKPLKAMLKIKSPESVKSYITVSEATTSDTSMYEDEDSITGNGNPNASVYSITDDTSDSDSDSLSNGDGDVTDQPTDLEQTGGTDTSHTETSETDSSGTYYTGDEEDEEGEVTFDNTTDLSGESDESDFSTGSDMNDSFYSDFSDDTEPSTGDDNDTDWEMTEMPLHGDVDSLNVPGVIARATGRTSPIGTLISLVYSRVRPRNTGRKIKTDEERSKLLREQAFRDRSWTLEECAICFDVMLRDQELVGLPCAHNFHAPCIGPWLQDRKTCPVCRKSVQ